MELQLVQCPLCRGNSHRDWGAENGFKAVKCLDCGFVYVNPRPNLADITEANKIGEHRTSDGSINVLYGRSAKKVAHYQSLIRQMLAEELRGRPLSWLDVGAGYGEFVEALSALLPAGSRVLGIEPMEQKAEAARLHNVPVSTQSLAQVQDRFDVVSLINVFSHLPDFDAFLDDIRRVLNDGGMLFLETGNSGDLESASDYPDLLYLPDHLAFAGIDHIKTFLDRNGFDLVAVHAQRRDTLVWVAKNVVKRMLGREVKLGLPYVSPFRTVFFKARLRSSAVAAA